MKQSAPLSNSVSLLQLTFPLPSTIFPVWHTKEGEKSVAQSLDTVLTDCLNY